MLQKIERKKENSHSNRCEIIFIYSLNLHFLEITDIQHVLYTYQP